MSVELPAGEAVRIVGPSGCGKSTLMRLIAGLDTPTRGTISIGGTPVAGPVPDIGIVFQRDLLLEWRSVLGNVMLPAEIKRLAGLEGRAAELLRELDVAGFAGAYPWQLSGGMQQRSNLCRALIHQPELLMLDEPFGALDAFTREELWGVMQALWLEKRFTGVLVTHDLREAVYLADTVYVMSRRPGRIVLSRKIDIPRPRTLETTFEPYFVDIVHELRDRISREHAS